MKIAVLAHNKFPIAEPYAGGLEMITHQLVQSLQENGHDVHLYALAGSDPRFKLILLDQVKTHSSELSDHAIETKMYRRALETIESIDYDVVHNHSMHELPLQWGATSRHQFLSSFHTPVFESIHKGLEDIQGKDHNQKFSVVSRKLGKTYSSLLPQWTVVYNGIDTAAWTFNPTPKKDSLCWVGRICQEKAPHLAIDYALKANKKIVLAGPVSNDEYHQKFIVPRLARKGVEYLGHLKHRELNALIGASEATLFTSVWDEPYGLVIAESLSCGTPVISFNVGAAPEILDASSGLIVELENEQAFLKAINKVTQLSRVDCRNRAVQFCDKKQMVDGYEKIYQEMIKEKLNRVAV